MRHPIIGDTTRSYYVVQNPYGDDEQSAGFYVAENCPVNGASIIGGPYRCAKAARVALFDILGL